MIKTFLYSPGLVALVLFTAFSEVAPAANATTSSQKNVLFIAVDDLRPQLGCYGDPLAVTPNADALAKTGTLFNRAYCQQAVCSPSRTSLLTGRRPDTTRIYDLKTHFRRTIPEVVTLPQHFRQHGYYARSIGKIYHGGLDDSLSWSRPAYEETSGRPVVRDIAETAAVRAEDTSATQQAGAKKEDADAGRKGPKNKEAATGKRGPAWESVNAPDEDLRDGQVATGAIELMNEAAGKPFFLAVGFVKPHLPFVAPKKYYDLYPPDKISLTAYPKETLDVSQYAYTNFGELRNYADIPKSGPIPEEKARELVRGYYAATSFMDAQLGRVLAELDRLKLRENTIIILWGDHGWHLGDLGQWCKHTNFDIATRAALMMSVPGQKAKASKSEALVEFVDIYPTLCEAAGLPLPDGLEGTSFAPLLDEPARPWKQAAFSQYPRKGVMGYTMKTDKYRYTEWLNTATSESLAAELYDHSSDPGETRNLAATPDQSETVQKLKAQLKAGWQAAKPPSK